ncbi:P27 family phage terminase small subunit [Solidesulfovibrio alcoholivorans]|uniref:P27 family phage terminase small subunit n=1 Tax=Solidesulfovibrio alcoholivorans TaxID=81406 RepID=UPI000496C2BD|nr:P27 family phage terminase small subunit [Solidesulfovibrio alcoholivorans]
MPKVIEVPRGKQACAPLKRNPRHLKGEAKRKWNDILAVLAPEVATERQFDVVTRYCIAWAAYMEAVTALETEPAILVNMKTGAAQPSPWTKIRIEMDKTLFSLGLKLGLIPNGRDIPATDTTPPASKFGGLVR